MLDYHFVRLRKQGLIGRTNRTPAQVTADNIIVSGLLEKSMSVAQISQITGLSDGQIRHIRLGIQTGTIIIPERIEAPSVVPQALPPQIEEPVIVSTFDQDISLYREVLNELVASGYREDRSDIYDSIFKNANRNFPAFVQAYSEVVTGIIPQLTQLAARKTDSADDEFLKRSYYAIELVERIARFGDNDRLLGVVTIWTDLANAIRADNSDLTMWIENDLKSRIRDAKNKKDKR